MTTPTSRHPTDVSPGSAVETLPCPLAELRRLDAAERRRDAELASALRRDTA